MRCCKNKLASLLILAGGMVVLAASLALPPGAEGWGEGGRWHLWPCPFKVATGWLLGREIPCATCGFTHAFSYAAHGQIGNGWRAQPAGMLAFFAMLAVMAQAGWSLVAACDERGAILGAEPRSSRAATTRRRWLWPAAAGAVLLAAWVYKIACVLF